MDKKGNFAMKKLILSIVLVLLLCTKLVSCGTNDPLSIEGYSPIDNDDLRLLNSISFESNSNATKIQSDYDIPPVQPSFWNAFESIRQGDKTFYLTKILESNYYFLCGYDDFFSLRWMRFNSKDLRSNEICDWYKVDKLENIERKIGVSKLKYLYIVFDCNIEKDIINQKDINYYCRFYTEIDISTMEKLNIDNIIKENGFILLESPDIYKQVDFPFLNQNNFGSDYWLHINKNGRKYLAMMDKTYGVSDEEKIIINDFHGQMFNYYNGLYEKFEPLEDLTNYFYEGVYHNSTYFERSCITYIGIDLESISSIFSDHTMGVQ